MPVLRHRILLNFHAESDRIDSDEILQAVARAEMPRAARRSLTCSAFLDPAVLAAHLGPRSGGEDGRGRFRRRPAPLARFRFQPGVRRIPRLHARRRPAPRRLERLRPHANASISSAIRGETNTQLTILLDASASMGYTSRQDHQARLRPFLAASLVYLAITRSATPPA